MPRSARHGIALSLVVVLGGLAALLFIPAGRLDWVEAWALIAAYTAFLAAYAWWGLRRDPDQLREHGHARKAENVKPWDKAIMAAYTVFLLLTFMSAGPIGARPSGSGRPSRRRQACARSAWPTSGHARQARQAQAAPRRLSMA